jgi:hypothetical protein
MTSRRLLLVDSRNGKMLQEWSGDQDQAAPTWAKGLAQ